MQTKILQGTTPSLTIHLTDVYMAAVSEIELTIRQGETVNIYHKADVTIDKTAQTITKHFSEAETLALDPAKLLQWQLRVKFTDGNIAGTPISLIRVSDLISEEVMA